MKIRPQPLSGSRLVADYLAGVPGATAFYGDAPSDPGAFARRWADVRTRFDRDARRRAADALRPTSARSADRLQRFVEEGGAVVTTGQQAGLFTGPLYTIYKALTTARLAAALEAELGVLVLPVFWVASEDHDWAEVNHAYLLDDADELRRVAVEHPDPRALPMSARTLPEDLRRVLGEVDDLLDGAAHAGEVLAWVREAYRPGRPVADAFAELLARLLAPFDVLLTDAADPHLKRASVPVLEGALRSAESHEALLRARSGALAEAGYQLQVPVLEGATNVFYEVDGNRERLYRDGDGWITHESRLRLDAARVQRELAGEPGRFSPNVFLRPVVESFVFPTLAYVAGPGEIAYFAQLSPLFGEFALRPPVAYPRFSATLVEERTERAVAALGIPLGELRRPWHELASRLARERMPPEVREALGGLASATAAGYAGLIEAAIGIDPTLAGSLGRLRNESLARIADAERRLVRSLKRTESAELARLASARAVLYPDGAPQERVLSVLSFLARLGPDLLRRMSEAIPVPPVGPGRA